ncbi:MAG: leucine-rich repeat protein [Paludibacteraceae bacterium]|nr:leucine-rich repeat protein [Paludibacteraceae bacterium]
MARRIFLALSMSWFALFASASNYLTFTAEEDNSSFCIDNYGSNNPNVEYSLDDGETWTLLEDDFMGNNKVMLTNKGDKALLRGNNPDGFSKYKDKYTHFKMEGKIAASGSIMSLTDGIGESETIPSEYCFYNLFYYCPSLTQAPELPATKLATYCYSKMFSYCENLTQAPDLPAMELADSCYYQMFSHCGNLAKAPELPATELAESCYEFMFYMCSQLTQAPELPATKLAKSCYENMFNWCSKLTQAPKLPATELAVGCYSGMFVDCTSLTQAPELPATVLAPKCYGNMFDGSGLTKAPALPATEMEERCYEAMFARTNLTQAPELPATKMVKYCYTRMFEVCKNLTKAPELPAMELAEGCYEAMFNSCTSLTQAPKLPATKLADYYCYQSMFAFCSNLTEAPELPAKELTNECYYEMFQNCENLQKIKVYFTDWKTSLGTFWWVYQVAPTGTFYCPKGLPLEYGEDRIPEGWNVEYIDDGTDVAEHVSDASFKAWGADGKITYIGASLPVEIYDLSGRLVKKVKEESQSVVMPQHGTYVVKTGTVSLKVEL